MALVSRIGITDGRATRTSTDDGVVFPPEAPGF